MHTSPAEPSNKVKSIRFLNFSLPARLRIRFANSKFYQIHPNETHTCVIDQDGNVVGVIENHLLRALYDPIRSYQVVYSTIKRNFDRISGDQLRNFPSGMPVTLPENRKQRRIRKL